MPTEVTNTFRDEKNKQVNAPITLYEVEIDDTTELDIAEYDVPVVYGGKVYTPFPITREGIPMNLSGEIDMVRVAVANVNQQMGAYLLANNGLRGKKVVMKLVFSSLLDDPDAHIDNEYWIDGAIITEQTATFNLTSKLDLLQVQIPLRSFIRDFCPWDYKKLGCWIFTGTYSPPSGFANAATQCDKTRKGEHGCEYHNNVKRFGGSPTMPARRVYVI